VIGRAHRCARDPPVQSRACTGLLRICPLAGYVFRRVGRRTSEQNFPKSSTTEKPIPDSSVTTNPPRKLRLGGIHLNRDDFSPAVAMPQAAESRESGNSGSPCATTCPHNNKSENDESVAWAVLA